MSSEEPPKEEDTPEEETGATGEEGETAKEEESSAHFEPVVRLPFVSHHVSPLCCGDC
jgi:hypothetical protein